MTVLLMIISQCLLAQSPVKGRVLDGTTNEVLSGVTVTSKNSNKSTLTGPDGSFSIAVTGPETLVLNFVGFLEKQLEVTPGAEVGDVLLQVNNVAMKEIIVTSNVAIDRKTPIAVTTVRAATIEERIGNKEFPEVLRSAPSTYVTKTGGGFGDSRINIRGFSQENVAVMINGVPVNDMENSRVYWSNWAGLSDIASNVQVQRGLGASKLSIGAVGGNINIVTKATEMQKGGQAAVMFGNDGYMKYTAGYSTGKGKSGLAFSFLGSHTEGNGYIDGTAFSAWNYFATLGWEINDKHTVTLTATGAPQWHHQRSYADNYQTYFGNPNDPTVINRGTKYNSSWGYYQGEEFTMAKNFYHKPVANLNYYWKVNSSTDLSAVAYASLGRGGGTGDFGRLNGKNVFSLPKDANGLIRFDDIAKWNSGQEVTDFGTTVTNRRNQPWTKAGPYLGQYVASANAGIVRRSSMNEHNWYGTILNLAKNLSQTLTLNTGVDLRYYKGLHYRRIEDLMGVNAWYETKDKNNPEKYAADESVYVDYNNDGIVKQYGGYASLEYNVSKLSLFAAGALSNTNYQRIDHFIYDKKTDPRWKSENKNFVGFVTKGGANYRINNQHNVFANVGYFEKAPFFNTVWPNFNNHELSANITNEKIFSTELGYGFRSKIASVNINAYRTEWRDKNFVRSAYNTTTAAWERSNIAGLIAEHKGIELEVNTRPINKLEVSLMGSVGDWKYKNNVEASIYDDNNVLLDRDTIFTKGLKVGDAAQTTANVSAAYEFFKGFKARATYFHAADLYANFQPENRTNRKLEGVQAWKLPSYGLLDGMLSYQFKIDEKKVTLRLNVDNLLDKKYISESVTDVRYNAADAKDFEIGEGGSGKSNRVYPGFGRTWTIGAKLNF